LVVEVAEQVAAVGEEATLTAALCPVYDFFEMTHRIGVHNGYTYYPS
jgi:hypothetical protein